MKKSTFWKLGLTAALLFGLSACSDTTSSDNEYPPEKKLLLRPWQPPRIPFTAIA